MDQTRVYRSALRLRSDDVHRQPLDANGGTHPRAGDPAFAAYDRPGTSRAGAFQGSRRDIACASRFSAARPAAASRNGTATAATATVCAAARCTPRRAPSPRSPSARDDVNWVLFNASPDILQQLKATPELQPARAIRDTGIVARRADRRPDRPHDRPADAARGSTPAADLLHRHGPRGPHHRLPALQDSRPLLRRRMASASAGERWTFTIPAASTDSSSPRCRSRASRRPTRRTATIRTRATTSACASPTRPRAARSSTRRAWARSSRTWKRRCARRTACWWTAPSGPTTR